MQLIGAVGVHRQRPDRHRRAAGRVPSAGGAGAGVGLVLPTLSAAATGPLPPARFATGTAVLGMSRQLGSALGVAILVAIIGHPTSADAVAAFRDGWTFMIISALAAATVLFAVGDVRIGSAVPEPVPIAATPAPETLAA